eukprot:CAMPEP_0176075974 /NCGR_PEP_ID=MMETSP0120_2-20121206/37975_1 /TAXON_ID=160619 /ORGANISM="Kryptoperidinium foliaceum, Strain CCMP 1326" /LENGTH=62 /DNA_ID=CAMNT_0017409683 /DNA_START=44 /DNA_END=232 /DNA_ORIENTATION=-
MHRAAYTDLLLMGGVEVRCHFQISASAHGGCINQIAALASKVSTVSAARATGVREATCTPLA